MPPYEGGYAAYVLARAERDRIAAATEERRQNLLRKELAWLRRGPPARTSKPRFRIEAANALIADEPPPRDRVELLRFATAPARQDGRTTLEDVTRRRSATGTLLDAPDLAARPGRPDRLVGVNGAGQDHAAAAAGRRAATPDVGHGACAARPCGRPTCRRTSPSCPATLRVLEAVEEVRRGSTLGDGRELTAGQLAERFGFAGGRGSGRRSRDLSGGERRRLQLLRLLMAEPNVLLLDEPTNDLDIDTLAALEDLLDSWPGTLVVVSHDRYLVERVCDDVYALAGDGTLRHLPGGIDEYLDERRAAAAATAAAGPAGGRADARRPRAPGTSRRRAAGARAGAPGGP